MADEIRIAVRFCPDRFYIAFLGLVGGLPTLSAKRAKNAVFAPLGKNKF